MGARRRPRAAALALALVALTLAAAGGSACGAGASASAGTSAAAGASAAADTPRRGGSLTFAFQGEPASLDPAIVWDIVGTQIEHQIYRGVLGYAPRPGAAGLEMVPDLATEVPTVANGGVRDGGKTFVFHLRRGVMFQAPVSREVTAQDFKYSFERMLREPLAPATYFYTGVAGAQEYYDEKAATVTGFRVLDRYTFAIDLTSPDLSFLKAFGGMDFCDVVPREWVEKWGTQFARHPLGTGPFVFDHWTPGREIVLKRNPDYWDKGEPYLDEVRYALSFSPQTAFLKLQLGQVDVLMNYLPAPDIARAKADPVLSGNIATMTKMATEYLFMNTRLKPFDDVGVRRALSWAVDRDRLVKLLGGQAEALYQVYPRSMPGHQAGKVFYGYDPAKARRLLAAAGYPDGFKTTLYSSNVDPYPKLMQAVQADLADVGVEVELKTLSDSAYGALAGTPGAATMGTETWSMDFPDPADWIIPIFSRSNAVEGGVNAAFWWTPALERMIVEAQALTDPEARLARYAEMQDYIMGQAPYITLYQPLKITVCSTNVGGFYLHQAYQWDTIHYWRR